MMLYTNLVIDTDTDIRSQQDYKRFYKQVSKRCPDIRPSPPTGSTSKRRKTKLQNNETHNTILRKNAKFCNIQHQSYFMEKGWKSIC